jgi:DNA-binding IclR family transcriptional regulator
MSAVLPHRDGSTYVHERDARRLAGQHCRVLAYLRDGQWHTLAEIAEHTHDPEASVSARLRDLRKPKFGGYIVEREYVARGLFRYRLKVGQLEL